METLNSASRQSIGLPSINHLDPDRIKREEPDHQRNHSSSAMVSPRHPFSASSQPHSNHQSSSANSMSGILGGLLSPPESRRMSGDEKDSIRAPARQSLPSIHEALGTEQPLPYSSTVPPPSTLAQAPAHYPSASVAASPSDQRPRTYQSDYNGTHGPSNPFSHPRSPYTAPSTSIAPPPPPPQARNEALPRTTYPEPRPPFSSAQPSSKFPVLHPLKTTQSPPPSTSRPNYPSYPPTSTPYESAAPQSAGSLNHHYTAAPYPPNYPQSAPSASAPNSAYPPSTSTYSAPPRYPPASWREGSDIARADDKKLNRASLAPYGESVKRHLESFDLEASLNEMADGAIRITRFSEDYRAKAHDNQRIGMTPQSVPSLNEVDDMIKQGERIQMSLQRMRDVVLNHHQASMANAPREPYPPMNGYGHDHEKVSSYGEEAKGPTGGFAGGDNKTRKRGRAAPPGRCHSCNRAETPEWRRGPDGARTLCNACGLHYAKLTRKMGAKAAMTSSFAKSLDHGSPAM